MKKILAVLLIISISLSCLLIAVELNAFDLNLYTRSFEKHNTSKTSGKDLDELESIAEDLTLYLDGKASNEILEANFNNREILHMEDVKELFAWGKLIRTISVVLALAISFYFYQKRDKRHAKLTFIGLFANWIILIALGLMIYIDFNKYFTIFHHIFFTNDLWLLNPKTDLLIQMLPEDFFMTMAIRIVVFFLAFLSIIQGILYYSFRRDRDNFEREREKKSIR